MSNERKIRLSKKVGNELNLDRVSYQNKKTSLSDDGSYA